MRARRSWHTNFVLSGESGKVTRSSMVKLLNSDDYIGRFVTENDH